MSEPENFATPVRLTNAIQPYAWGSRTLLADFLGQPNRDGGPQAELWIGSHPRLPSRVATGAAWARLDEWIRRAPDAVLGAEVAQRFGAELPFLLKVLAVGAPLSIQCHPDRAQARAGFEREERLGLAPDAPQRSYRDRNHKPELIVALRRFTALKGFRPVEQTVAALRALDLPPLGAALGPLLQHGEGGLEGFFSSLLSLTKDDQAQVVNLAAHVAAARAANDPAWEWVSRLSGRYPGDVGVLSPLYLNLVVLEPGQGLYVPAGELHGYLEGLGLEIMANSDNVLRGGLTPKHVDVSELTGLLQFRSEQPSILAPQSRPDGASVYATPAEEFELGMLRLKPAEPLSVGAHHGVEILLVLEGRARLTASMAGAPRVTATTESASGAAYDSALELERGAAALIPATAGGYGLAGDALLARARVPRP